MMRSTRLHLTCVGTCICRSFEKLNSTLNRLRIAFKGRRSRRRPGGSPGSWSAERRTLARPPSVSAPPSPAGIRWNFGVLTVTVGVIGEKTGGPCTDRGQAMVPTHGNEAPDRPNYRSCSLSGGEYRLGGRPRTVFGCLVGRVSPAGRGGVAPRWRLPPGPGGSVVPVRVSGVGCSGGSSPGPDPLVRPGHAFPSPRLVAVRASSDDDRGRVVPGRHLLTVPQRCEPVLGRPAGGAGRVHRDHVQPGVGGHLREAVPEAGGGQARGDGPVPAAPGARPSR